MLTIDDVIERFDGSIAYSTNSKEICQYIADLLKELKERREAPEIIYCHECIHFQCNMRFDGSVPKGADAYECRHLCGGCDPMDYCSYGERAERRTDE